MPRHSSQPAPGHPQPGPQPEAPAPPLRALPDAGWPAGAADGRWPDAGQAGEDEAGWQDDGWIAAEQGSRGPVWPAPAEQPGAAEWTSAPGPGPDAAGDGEHPGGWAGPEDAGEWPAGAWAAAGADAGGTGWPSAAAGDDQAAVTGSEPGPATAGGLTPGDERWAMLGYLGVPFTGFVLPLVIYLLKRRTSPFVRWHAGQALNLAVTAILWLISLGYLVRAAVGAGSGQHAAIPGWLCATIVHGGDQALAAGGKVPA